MSVGQIISKLEEAKNHLKQARSALNSAGLWSVVDIIGFGGVLADIFEYSEFSDAKKEVQQAAKLLKEVEAELRNMGVQTPEINHTLLWAFFDVGFDGIIIDLLRHFKINEAKDKVDETIRAVDQLIFRLKQE